LQSAVLLLQRFDDERREAAVVKRQFAVRIGRYQPGEEPLQPYGAYTDWMATRFGTVMIIAALEHRRRTGEGQFIDMSQYEASNHFLAPLFLDYQANGRIAGREGNRCSHAAPHDVFPCRGEDRWCAVAAFDDGQWKTFAHGTKIGSEYVNDFQPITARQVRLNILDATDGPTIWEFQLLAPKK